LGLTVGLGVVFLSIQLGQAPHRVVKILLGAVAGLSLLSLPAVIPYILLFAMPLGEWLPKSPIPFVNAVNLLMGLSLLSVLLRTMGSRERAEKLPAIWIAFALFMLAALLAFLRGWILPPAGVGFPVMDRLKDLWNRVGGILTFLAFYRLLESRRAVRGSLLVMSIALALGAFACIRQAEGARMGYRVGGGIGQANTLAAFYASGLCFLLPIVVARKSVPVWMRVVLLATTAVSVMGLVLPNSRGAFIGFVVSLFIVTAMYKPKFLIPYIAVIVLGWACAPDTVRERLATTYTGVVDADYEALDKDSGGRLDVWNATMRVARENAVLGVGFENLPAVLVEDVGYAKNSHNVYLQLWGEGGLPWLAAFLAILYLMMRTSRRLAVRRDDPFARAIGIGGVSMVLCMFIVNMFGDRLLVWGLEQLMVFVAAISARVLVEPAPEAG
jgi:O-antigen ligase